MKKSQINFHFRVPRVFCWLQKAAHILYRKWGCFEDFNNGTCTYMSHIQVVSNGIMLKKVKSRLPPLRFRLSCRVFCVIIIHCFKDNGTILDKVLSLKALCFYLQCTDRDVWIASKRLRVFFVRARRSPSTALVKRSIALISLSCSSRQKKLALLVSTLCHSII